MATEAKNRPDYKDSCYNEHIDYWDMMSDFQEGVEDIQKRLIKWEAESDTGYKSRQKNAVLFNATKKTVNAATGLIFKNPLTYTNLNSTFTKYLEDVDLQGTNLNEFGKELCKDGLWMGISFVLVDMPLVTTEIVNQEQQNALGIRPYFVRYSANQLLNKRYENIGGKMKLTQCTLEENITVPDGAFGEAEIQQYRVLRIGGGSVYQKDKDENFIEVQSWTNQLDYIPLIPFYTNKEGYYEAYPLFQDLAMLNLKHYNFQSQLDKTLYVSANPVPCFWGKTDNEKKGQQIVIGVDKAMQWGSKEDGDFEWKEFQGTAVDKLHNEIERIEIRMSTLGLSMITSQNNREITATEKNIDSAQEQGDLQSIAISLEATLNACYRTFNDLLKLKDDGKITVNRDFVNQMITTDQARSYLEMYKQGTMSLDTLWDNLEKGEYIEKIVDRDVEKANLENAMNTPSIQ